MIWMSHRGKVIVLSVVSVLLGSNCAVSSEYLCTYGKRDIVKGETAACYTDHGCAFIAKLGADPIRDFDQASAPYALARGKIVAIVTSYPSVIQKVKSVGGSCRTLSMPN
jgi:hypothetical protein